MKFLNFSNSNRIPSMVDEAPPREITDDKALLVEVWKKTIEVQQHFNDLSWRIRALWLTALTFVLGATFLAYREADPISLGCLGETSPAFVIPILGIFLWLAFWFVDALWYHRLLSGSVAEGLRIEKELEGLGFVIRLTQTIGDKSPVSTCFGVMHSKDKLNAFYVLGGLPLILSAFVLIFV